LTSNGVALLKNLANIKKKHGKDFEEYFDKYFSNLLISRTFGWFALRDMSDLLYSFKNKYSSYKYITE
jgi:hypothetical protein